MFTMPGDRSGRKRQTGGGGGGGISGTGTTNTITKWTSATTIGDSNVATEPSGESFSVVTLDDTPLGGASLAMNAGTVDGSVTLSAGNALSGNTAGAGVSIFSGNASGNGIGIFGGPILIQSGMGSDTTAAGGLISVVGGDSLGAGAGGSIQFFGGGGGTDGAGGDIAAFAGGGGSSGGAGGSFTFNGGSAQVDGNGGAVGFTAGNGGSSTGVGGDIAALPGTGPDGNGTIQFIDPTSLGRAHFDLTTFAANSNHTFRFPDSEGTFSVTTVTRADAQTAANGAVTTLTVGASDSSYRVSANVNVTTSTTHNFTVTCAYTDETGAAQTLTLGLTQAGGATVLTAITDVTGSGPYHGLSYHIRAQGASTITIATTGTFTTVVYNVEGSIVAI